MVNALANYKVFSTPDLKRACHQVPIKKSDLKYTGFEANGRLYHFHRIPFGVTNGVAAFQRAMDKIVEEDGLNQLQERIRKTMTLMFRDSLKLFNLGICP